MEIQKARSFIRLVDASWQQVKQESKTIGYVKQTNKQTNKQYISQRLFDCSRSLKQQLMEGLFRTIPDLTDGEVPFWARFRQGNEGISCGADRISGRGNGLIGYSTRGMCVN